MSDFGKSVKQLNQSYESIIKKNANVRIGVVGLLLLYTILVVPLLSHDQLSFLENNVVRIVAIIKPLIDATIT